MKTEIKREYSAPQLQELNLETEGVLCQSGMIEKYDELDYEW